MAIKEKKVVSKVVRDIFDRMSVGTEFSGLDFKKLCVREAPEFRSKYEDTFLRLLRMYRRSQFICCDRFKSKYKKVA